MLDISIREASIFSNSLNYKKLEFPIKKRRIFIGRGEDVQEKENQQDGCIDLSGFSDNTISRVHAQILFSPAWFRKGEQSYPSFLSEIKVNKVPLPCQIVSQIWKFIAPIKSCIVKDLKSKYGIYERTYSVRMRSEMYFQFSQGFFLQFQNQMKFSSFQELQLGLKQVFWNEKPTKVLGNFQKIKNQIAQAKSQAEKEKIMTFWRATTKQYNYIILKEQGRKLRIGRSSHCDIQIKDTAISRYQAYLLCENLQWIIVDGNQVQKSKNGTWLRKRIVQVKSAKNRQQLEKNQAKMKNQIRIGSLKVQLSLVQQFQWLGIDRILSGKQKDESFIKLGLKQPEKNQAS